MTYKISAQDAPALRLHETDTVAGVLQNIAIILATRKGSVPLYREFGLDQSFLDRPIPVAKPMLYAAAKEAIETFEPRATVINVAFAEDAAAPGRLRPIVEVEIHE